MKTLFRIVLLSIIDFIVIWLWVKQMNPDPSVSIATLLLVPFVVVLNLLIALILYFIKRKFAHLFLINAMIAGILMNYLFVKGIDRHQNTAVESWEFKIGDTTYCIGHWKADPTFSILESTMQGSSTEFLSGKFIKRGNEYHLTTDSTDYVIKNDTLYRFRDPADSIKLIKIER